MTMQQWDTHKEHLQTHVKWPATKEDILATCNNMSDVEDSVKGDLMYIPEKTYNSPEDLHSVLM